MSTTTPKGFLALPAEMRNHIYELAFTPNTSQPVNLFEADPPSKSLLLTNHQIHNEASQYFQEAYKAYWRDASFIIDRRVPTAAELSPSLASRGRTVLCWLRSKLAARVPPEIEHVPTMGAHEKEVAAKHDITMLRPEVVEHIRHIKIIAKAGGRTATSTLVDVRGLWKSTTVTEPDYWHLNPLVLHRWVVRRRADRYGGYLMSYDREDPAMEDLQSVVGQTMTMRDQILGVLRTYELWEWRCARGLS